MTCQTLQDHTAPLHAGHDLLQIASSLLDTAEHTPPCEAGRKKEDSSHFEVEIAHFEKGTQKEEASSHLRDIKELLLQIIGAGDGSAQRPHAQTLCVDTTRPPGLLFPGFPSGNELAAAPRRPVSGECAVRLGQLARALLESRATLALPAGGTQEDATTDIQVRPRTVYYAVIADCTLEWHHVCIRLKLFVGPVAWL